MTTDAIHRTIEAVWHMESARIIGALARVLRDVGLAEELAQDALVAALEQWPTSGVPDNPAAWLTAAAKHRAIDLIRRRELHARKADALTYEIETQLVDAAPDLDAAIERAFDEPIGDDLLRLIFIACHPVLSREARLALTLRLLGGLTTDEIARAFLRQNRRSRSGSCAPNARWPSRAPRSRCPHRPNSRRGSLRSSR